MRSIIALIRISLMAAILIIGSIAAYLTTFIPQPGKEITMANTISRWIAKSYMIILNVRLDCKDRHLLREHRGFLFPNHDSFLDIILPASITPVRFLAAIEVKRRPFIGRLGTSVGCVYVDRGNRKSREVARNSLTNLVDYPPIIIYPEGMLDGKPGIAPFRHGAFEIVRNNEMAYMLVTILYEDFWKVRWKDESMLAAIWRVAKMRRVNARMVFLPVVHPKLNDNVIELARSAEKAITASIVENAYPAYADVHPDDKPEKPANSWENEAS